MRTVLRAGLLVALTTTGGTACATTRAETPRERPVLDVPIPPPREITPLPAPETPAPAPVSDLPGSAVNTPLRPRPQREPQSSAQKPEQKSDESKPTETPPPVAAPVPQLRIPEAGDTAQSASQIRSIIERAKGMLDKINYGPLSDVLKKAYDDAKMFAAQAEKALELNNLVFARELADKAERLAKEIQGR